MATTAQIQANDRNSHKSTGPTSAMGNAVDRFSALKTGNCQKGLPFIAMPCRLVRTCKQRRKVIRTVGRHIIERVFSQTSNDNL
jgi:hypothetical protein